MFSAMVRKEFLLIFRDKQAILALFLLPIIFIIIMSVAMRDQFSTAKIEFNIFVEDKDKSNMSQELLTKFKISDNLLIVNRELAQFSIIIPKNYSIGMKTKIDISVKDAIKSNQIEIFKSIIAKYILSVRLSKMAKEAKKYSAIGSKDIQDIDSDFDSLYQLKYNGSNDIPNSTQQSVPAWIVFGMFFIIIPMSTIYVNERKQNTLSRLNTMNISIVAMSLSKAIPYLLINQIQVWIMLLVGMFLVPLFNTPALEINGTIGAIFSLSIALSLSAIGITSLIAVSATSSEQATTIGGISNILLGAIGGIMVPKFMMPDTMQNLANISPMSWGLDGFLKIFLNSADISMIKNEIIALLFFGIITLILSMVILDYRIKKGL